MDFENEIKAIERMGYKFHRVTNLTQNSDEPIEAHEFEEGEPNLITSQYITNWHLVQIDLDIDHVYVPSSTPGHGHLYLSNALILEDYIELQETLEKFDIVGPGWVEALKKRGYTSLRVPGVKK